MTKISCNNLTLSGTEEETFSLRLDCGNKIISMDIFLAHSYTHMPRNVLKIYLPTCPSLFLFPCFLYHNCLLILCMPPPIIDVFIYLLHKFFFPVIASLCGIISSIRTFKAYLSHMALLKTISI